MTRFERISCLGSAGLATLVFAACSSAVSTSSTPSSGPDAGAFDARHTSGPGADSASGKGTTSGASSDNGSSEPGPEATAADAGADQASGADSGASEASASPGDTGTPGTDSGKAGRDSGTLLPPGCSFDGHYDSASNRYPPGGCFPWYPASVFFKKLPANPVVDPNSEQYNLAQGQNNGGTPALTPIATTPQTDEPVYYTDGDGVTLTIDCTGVGYSQSTCSKSANRNGDGGYTNLNGASINFPPKFIVEDGYSSGGDHHMSRIDTTRGDEFEAWGATQPSTIANGVTFDMQTAGLCDLHGDGVGCGGSTATSLPYSLGLIKAEDILACLDSSDTSCTLPYALAWTPPCNSDRYIYPGTYSDGQCGIPTPPSNSLSPVEGSRGFLAMTDARVNSLSVPDYEKVVLRTIDQEHFGFIDTDTQWGGQTGPTFQTQGSAAYTTFGNADPWAALAKREGMEASTDGSYSFAMDANGIDTVKDIKWCAATSSGLCDGKGSGPSLGSNPQNRPN